MLDILLFFACFIHISPNCVQIFVCLPLPNCQTPEPMLRRVEKYKGEEKVSWICKDRRKGKKGNGCKNLIIPEEELLEALTEALGNTSFDNLKAVKIYDDGRMEVELIAEKKTA